MGRVGSWFDMNAAAEAFFSSLEWEMLSRHDLPTVDQVQPVVLEWCYGFYNHNRRHFTIGMVSPITYENTAAADLADGVPVDRPRDGPPARRDAVTTAH